MIDWRYILCESSTMNEIGELKSFDKSLNTALNESGNAGFRVSLEDPLTESIEPISKCVLCLREKEPVWSGPIWTMETSANDGFMTVGAVGWFEILMKRLTKSKKSYSSRDVGEIIKALMDDAAFDGPLWITLGTPYLTGQLIAFPDMPKYSKVGEIIKGLSNLENGFDWRIHPITRQLFIEPRRGTTKDAMFSYGWGPSNLQSANRRLDGSSTINQIFVGGNSEQTGAAPVQVFPFETPTTFLGKDNFNTHAPGVANLTTKTAEIGGGWSNLTSNNRTWSITASSGPDGSTSITRGAVVSPQDATNWVSGANIIAPSNSITGVNSATLQHLDYWYDFVGSDHYVGLVSIAATGNIHIGGIVYLGSSPPTLYLIKFDFSVALSGTALASIPLTSSWSTNHWFSLRLGTDNQGRLIVWHWDPLITSEPVPKIIHKDVSMALNWNGGAIYARNSSQQGNAIADNFFSSVPVLPFYEVGFSPSITKYGLLEENVTLAGVSVLENLQGYAAIEVLVRETPRATYDLTTVPTNENIPQPFKDYDNGDTIKLVINKNKFNTGSNPLNVRVFGVNVAIDNNGQETTNIITTPSS